jgi:hypothetical protein
MNEDDTGEDQENWGREIVADDRHGDDDVTNEHRWLRQWSTKANKKVKVLDKELKVKGQRSINCFPFSFSLKAVALFLRPVFFFFDPALGQFEVVDDLGVDLNASAEVSRHLDVAGLHLVVLLHVEALDVFLDGVEAVVDGLDDALSSGLVDRVLKQVADLDVLNVFLELEWGVPNAVFFLSRVEHKLRLVHRRLLLVHLLLLVVDLMLLLLVLDHHLLLLMKLHLLHLGLLLLLLDHLHGTHLAEVLVRSGVDPVRGFDLGDDCSWLLLLLLLLLGSGDDDAGASFAF